MKDFQVINDLLLFQIGDGFPKPNFTTFRNFFYSDGHWVPDAEGLSGATCSGSSTTGRQVESISGASEPPSRGLPLQWFQREVRRSFVYSQVTAEYLLPTREDKTDNTPALWNLYSRGDRQEKRYITASSDKCYDKE